ncbi:hypothetical protein, partial [Microbaculum marinum]
DAHFRPSSNATVISGAPGGRMNCRCRQWQIGRTSVRRNGRDRGSGGTGEIDVSTFSSDLRAGIGPAAILIALTVIFAVPPAAEANFGVATFSVSVKRDGGAFDGNGVKGAARTGTGRYYVQFMRDVSHCMYAASVRGKNGGQVSIKQRAGNPQRLRFFTFSRDGEPRDLPFDVTVSCNGGVRTVGDY